MLVYHKSQKIVLSCSILFMHIKPIAVYWFSNPVTNKIDFKGDELNSYLLDQYKVVFFGEQHNTVFDPQVKYHLITDLNRRNAMRHVFFEMSVSRAWHCNKYLQTGDTSYLYTSKSSRFNPYTVFYKKLYAYNSQLPDSLKIVIHGIDFETTDVFLTLTQLAPKGQTLPAALRPVMDTIEAHVSDPGLKMWDMVNGKFTLYDNTAFIKTLKYVQGELKANTTDVQNYFGDNYPVVQAIATNDAPVEVAPRRRNKAMFAAIEKAVDEQHIDRFIGFFGGMHTSYSEGSSLSNATKRLKNISANDVINIMEFAYNTKSTDTAYRSKNYQEIVNLNGTCQATLLPAREVPGYKKQADFVVIVDITE